VNGLLYTQTDPTVGHIGATGVDPPGAHWVGGGPTGGTLGWGWTHQWATLGWGGPTSGPHWGDWGGPTGGHRIPGVNPPVGHIGATGVDPPGAHWVGGGPTSGPHEATGVDPPGSHWVGGEPTWGHMGRLGWTHRGHIGLGVNPPGGTWGWGCSLMSTVALFMPPSHRKQSVRLSVCLSVPA